MLRKREDFLKMCRENLSLKVLAITLATVAIFSIQRITNQTEEFEVPIHIEGEPGMAILHQDARTAYITCRGSLEDLRRLDQTQLRLIVRTRPTGVAGTAQVPIGIRNVQGVPRSITVTTVRPNLLNLSFDREIEKQVTVARPELLGQPAIGRAEVEYSPKIVTVRGPQQLLADLKIITPPPIDIDNTSVSFSRDLPIQTDDEMGVWEVIPATISTRVNIVTEAINREWPELPIMILRNPETDLVFKPEPPVVNVSLLGSPRAVNQIQPEDIRVFIDCTNIMEPGIFEVPATAHFARSADISSGVTPPIITVQAVHMPQIGTNHVPAETFVDPTANNMLEQHESEGAATPEND